MTSNYKNAHWREIKRDPNVALTFDPTVRENSVTSSRVLIDSVYFNDLNEHVERVLSQGLVAIS